MFFYIGTVNAYLPLTYTKNSPSSSNSILTEPISRLQWLRNTGGTSFYINQYMYMKYYKLDWLAELKRRQQQSREFSGCCGSEITLNSIQKWFLINTIILLPKLLCYRLDTQFCMNQLNYYFALRVLFVNLRKRCLDPIPQLKLCKPENGSMGASGGNKDFTRI